MRGTPVRAKYFDQVGDDDVRCRLCPCECRLKQSAFGICGVRKNKDGVLYALTYGKVTHSSYDPVEKKPLYHFFPGRRIFSISGWGCNLKCTFCQNSAISQFESPTVPLSAREVAKMGVDRESIGVAYTYNEPTISIEYVMDCAEAVRKAGGKNVLVTNGYINPGPLRDLLPLVDAVNLDIKAFNNDFYKRLCKGSLEPVLETAMTLAQSNAHLEVTTLVIPEENDAVPELEDLSGWIAEHLGRRTPCHLTAYHPSYQYTKTATTTAHLSNARYIFKKRLDYVYLGNMPAPGGGDTVCVNCRRVVIRRSGLSADLSGMNRNGACANCGADNNIVVS